MKRIKNFMKKMFSFTFKTVVSLVVISIPASAAYTTGVEAINNAKAPGSTMSAIASWLPFMEVQEKSFTIQEKYQILMNNENFLYLSIATACTFLVVMLTNIYLAQSSQKKINE